jgi:hypothetical protein
VPPQLQALPEPGAVVPPEATLAELKDHDESRKVSQEELQRQQEEFCRKNYDAGRALGDPTLDLIEGPLGTCRNSVFSAIKKINQPDE